MPTVPRTTTTIAAQGIPSARRTGAPTREELGAGVGELAAGIGVNVLQREAVKARRAADEERERANQIAVLDARRQLSDHVNTALYDPQRGALTRKGSDAFEIIETTRAGFDGQAAALSAGLTNDDQRLAFAKIVQQERDNVDGVTNRHTAQERQRYDDDTTQAVLESAQSSAITNRQDPRKVGQDIRTMVETIEAHGKRTGLSPERINQRTDALISDTHVQVIDGLLADGNDRAAGVYFQEVRDARQLQGPAIAKIERALEEGTLRGESQRQSDAILAAGGSQAEQLEKARKIDDPKLRDATRERIEHEHAIADRAERERHDALLVNAGNTIDRTGSVNTVPPAEWAQLTVGEKTALKAYAKAKAEGIEPTTDRATYYALAQQAADDPAGFGKRNLWLDRNRLADTEWKQVVGWQMAAKGGAKPDKTLDGIRTNMQIANGALAKAGFETTPDEGTPKAAANARFYEELDKRVLALQDQTGKAASNADVQQIADDLLTEVVTTKGVGIWGALTGQGPVSDVKARKFTIDPTNPGAGPRPVDQVQVPTADRAYITQALTSRGRQPTEEAIRAYYLAALAQGSRPKGSPSR